MEKNIVLPASKSFKTLHKYDTIYSADSVEWCPHEPSRNYFVCGNYQLTEEKESDLNAKRLGRILLFSLTDKLNLHQIIETAAVLDQKWCPNQINNYPILGVVNAKNTLEIYRLETNKLKFLTKFIFSNNNDHSENLILSLDWSTGKYESQQPYITCSDSKGNIHLLQLVNNELKMEKSWHGHDFEAWITGFYYWDPNIIFSGGDDAIFLKFDKRLDSPVAKNRQHETGVTSFHSNKSKEYLVATGSYDKHVRLWDIRNIKNPLSQLKLPGTLWRLKWDPFGQKYLLAACMLGGLHVINAQSNEMNILDSYYEHKNITYGADWCFLHENDIIIGSCSFYDHLLCISCIKL